MDRCLPFGLRSLPKIFSAVSDSLAWVFRCLGVYSQIHYLDDFLFFGRPGSSEAGSTLSVVVGACSRLGDPIASHKTEWLATSLTFLGIMQDTVRFELRLPPDKLRRLQVLTAERVGRKSCNQKQLESFSGHLSHTALVVRQG